MARQNQTQQNRQGGEEEARDEQPGRSRQNVERDDQQGGMEGGEQDVERQANPRVGDEEGTDPARDDEERRQEEDLDWIDRGNEEGGEVY